MKIELVSKYNMLPKGSRVLCAVSGGVDSMCLLHLLLSKRRELGIELFAAHYEHGLRGEESLRDAQFVSAWCAENGIPCTVEHGDVAAYAMEKGMGTEQAARELRYDFLHRTAEKLRCDKIATAHNADDNAETIIFNLCRGTGGAGLRGIPPVRENIVRPLLGCTRAEIEEYLEKNAVPHVEDSSNATDDYSRNLIRHRVMPVLRELNPSVSTAALRAAELSRQDEDCLSALADEFIERHFDGESLPQKELRQLHPAIASRVLRALCGGSQSMVCTERAMALLEGSEYAEADISGRRIRRERGRIYFNEAPAVSIAPRRLIPGQTLEIPELKLRLKSEICRQGEEINDLFKTCGFYYDNICGNIFCTGKFAGDKMRPLGRGCTKSLKSLFAEKKMTRQQRESALVFRDDEGILAVRGLCVDQRAAAKAGDKILRIYIENTDMTGIGR